MVEHTPPPLRLPCQMNSDHSNIVVGKYMQILFKMMYGTYSDSATHTVSQMEHIWIVPPVQFLEQDPHIFSFFLCYSSLSLFIIYNT